MGIRTAARPCMIHSEPARLAGLKFTSKTFDRERVIQKYCLALRRPIGRQTGRQIAIGSKPSGHSFEARTILYSMVKGLTQER